MMNDFEMKSFIILENLVINEILYGNDKAILK